jgi:hypothetical protein
MNVRSVFIAILMLFAFDAQAQQTDLLMGRWHASQIEERVLNKKALVHLGYKPIFLDAVTDSLSFDFLSDSSKYYSKMAALVMRDHAIQIKGKDYELLVDVLFDYGLGQDYYAQDSSLNLFTGVRGGVVQGKIGKRFQFNTGLYEAQMLGPAYLREYRDSTGILPGWGRVKSYKEGGFDYSRSFGRMSVDLMPSIQLAMGYGNHFIGHGYRSLLLTDGLMNSPYVELGWRSNDGRFQYHTWYATLQTLERLPQGDTPESLFKRKSGHFHYLSLKPWSWLEIGFFEGMISPLVTDSTIVKRKWNQFQPIIGVNSLIEGWDGSQNVYAGLNLSFQFPGALIYGQYMLDDPSTKRSGFQFGAKSLSLLIENLDFQIEYNQTGEFSYSARTDLAGLNHFNQPIGHPLGGAVKEWVLATSYRYHRFFGRVKGNLISHESGPSGQWNASEIIDLESNSVNTRQLECQIGYQLNLKTNAEIILGYTYREGDVKSNIYFIGIRTNLHNNYFDF